MLEIVFFLLLAAGAITIAVRFGHRTPAGLERATPASQDDLHALAGSVRDLYESAAHPKDVANHPKFVEVAKKVASSQSKNDQLLDYISGDAPVLACLVVEALAERGGIEIRDLLLGRLNATPVPYVRYFLLRAIDHLTPANEPVIGRVLATVDSDWNGGGFFIDKLTEHALHGFVQARVKKGEIPAIAQQLEGLSGEQVDTVEETIKSLEPAVSTALLKELTAWRSSHADTKWLASWGKVWTKDDAPAADTIAVSPLPDFVDGLESLLSGERRRSAVIVGESGVGKSALIRLLIDHLIRRDWIVFEGGPNELVAGQSYVGQLEKRLQKLVRQLGANRKMLWYIPDLPPLATAGSHSSDPTGALDVMLPLMEKGEISVLSEVQPGPLENVIRQKPRLATAAEFVRMQAASAQQTRAIAEEWSRRNAPAAQDELAPRPILNEALALAQHYLRYTALPGSLMELLGRAHRTVLKEPVPRPLGIDDIVTALSSISGISRVILDEREHLDLGELRSHFESRVFGQPEAVEVLVDRLALIKAGLTDPTRPLGVFLFAGPTGTGKTEIAKTLAGFLFGSADRLIRLDMSELKSADTVSRLVGYEGSHGRSLVEQVRKEPFSILLLDEFEKAHPNIWDYFLQVFDDGRLSDWQGRTADFRHCLIIMTSNIGASIQTFGNTGFVSAGASFQPSNVFAALEREFRKEFLNRIDRVVVFRPLSRETMRGILRKELNDAYERRGLRTRPWAIEWDDSAMEFLLEKGFTMDLGARPLKRAVEQYVLAPIARTIVNRQFPSGDQFLFVRAAGDQLAVDFVDPDAAVAAPVPSEPPAGISLQSMIVDPRGRENEVSCLESEVVRLRSEVTSAGWTKSKAVGMSMMSLAEFWSSPERFSILNQVEYRDRIETGFRTAESLLRRLHSSSSSTRGFPRDLIARLAQQLFLLRNAVSALESNIEWDAFLSVEVSDADAQQFKQSLVTMYRNWAKERGMLLTDLSDRSAPGRNLFSVSGFAAYSLLAPEDGLHVLEVSRAEGATFDRLQARVRVVPQPPEPATPGEPPRQLALRTLEQHPPQPTVVRRYREDPSPLVRDSVRNWRTGRLDLVLAGQFDLLQSD